MRLLVAARVSDVHRGDHDRGREKIVRQIGIAALALGWSEIRAAEAATSRRA